MSSQKLVKKISVNKNGYYIDIVVGVIGSIVSFLPFLKEFNFVGLPVRIAIPTLSVILIAFALYRLSKLQDAQVINIYEDHISIGDFKSSRDDLVIKVKGNIFTFSNSTESIVFQHKLSKADYNYLRELT